MPDEPSETATNARRGGGRRLGLTIQSRILVMLIVTSLVSALVVGVVGYVNGRESLQASAIDQVTTIRELRAHELEHAIEVAQETVVLESRTVGAVAATEALEAGWEAAQSEQLTAAQSSEPDAYYAEQFIPMLEERTGAEYADDALIPESDAGRYLQYWYTSQGVDYDEKLQVDDAGDGSAYSAAHAEHHDYFRTIVESLEYDDLMVINPGGDIIYSAYKGTDLGTNLDDGPFQDSMLADAFHEIMATNSIDTSIVTDFSRWIPGLNTPSMWIVSPVGTAESGVVGALAAQVPVEFVNEALTGDHAWSEQGLGDTGEVYVAGRDDLMRSESRLLYEDPAAYEQAVVANGTPPDTAARAVSVAGTVLLQPVSTTSVNLAQSGETGTTVADNYLGHESIVAYAPLHIEGLDWVIVAHVETSEAFAPVDVFTRNLVLWTLGMLIAASLASLLLAQAFSRPVRALGDAVRKVSGGDLAVEVPQGSRDEFGDLGAAFNDLTSSLRIKQDLLDEQRAENQRLLLTLMPESLATRYKQGEEAIAELHENVAVVYAELVGFDEHARALSSDEEIAELNELMRGFDDAAAKAGVEKVRTLRGGYLASSGLAVPRVDNVRRAVDFAREMQVVVDRFNAQNGTDIALRAGVDSGTVTSGLVGRTSLAYDLWGDAVNLAFRVRSVTDVPGIYVSQSVHDRLGETVTFEEAGTIELRGASQPVWRVA